MKKKSKELAGSVNADAPHEGSAPSPRNAKPAAGAKPRVNAASADGNAKAAVLPAQPKVTIDPQIRAMNLPLSAEEEALLEQSVLHDGGPREPLVIWKGFGFLIDGHHRYDICRKHGLPYAVREIEFADRAAVMDWIEQNQDGRRNTTLLGLKYRRGRRYNDEKQGHGGSRTGEKASGQTDPLRTAERMAVDSPVSAKTIRREGEFAAAVDLLAARYGIEIRRLILTQRAKLSLQAVLRLSTMNETDQPKAVDHLLKFGRMPVPPRKKKERMQLVGADIDELAYQVVIHLNKAERQVFRAAIRRHEKSDAELMSRYR